MSLGRPAWKEARQTLQTILSKEEVRVCGAVAKRLRHRSREQKVPSSIPRSGISVHVTSQRKKNKLLSV